MKNIKLIGAIIASVMISTASFAGELTFTGSAEVAYNINGSDGVSGANNSGRALGISNDITWTGTGETDNGWTWVVSGDLDGGTADDTYLTLTMGGMGTLGFYNNDGSLNLKHSANVSVYKVASDVGTSGDITDAYDLSGTNNVRYTLPNGVLPFGTTLAAGFYAGGTSATVDPGDAGSAQTIKSIQHYQLTTAPVEGLKVMADYYTKDSEGEVVDGGQKEESGTVGLTYAMGAVKIGLSESRVAPAISSTTSTYNWIRNRTYSAAFALNDNLSLSYSQETSAKQGTSVAVYDITVDAIEAAYNMGGMTFSIMQKGVENAGYATGVNANETLVGIKMAF